VDRSIGQHITPNAQIMQILLTKEALNGLYQRLEILTEELRYADLLFRLIKQEDARAIYQNERDPWQLRRERGVPIVLAQVLQHQNRRLSLPPLPEFPSEEQIEAAREESLRQQSQKVPGLPQQNSNETMPDEFPLVTNFTAFSAAG
jgi:hypothetical protein